MANNKKNNQSWEFASALLIPLAFAMCAIYWAYIASISEMVIAHDAIGYERLGEILSSQGWKEYFQNGPNREPLYHLLISWAIILGRKLSISYQTIQILFQLTLLTTTQLLALKIMRRLNINNLLCALAILYLGFSPAIVNSAFILYSEIITYPFILSLLLLNLSLWEDLKKQLSSQRPLFLGGIFLGLNLLLLIFAKGIFEILALCFFIPYFLWMVRSYLTKNTPLMKKLITVLLASLVVFYVPVFFYKHLNKIYNGHFALTDRGAWALYGQTARRTQPLDFKKTTSAIAFVPSWKFCLQFFATQECQDWSFIPSDTLGAQKREELRQHFPAEKVDSQLMRLSVQTMLTHPFQYTFLLGVESLKMFFWEAPTSQYIIFPKTVIKLYSWKPFSLALLILSPILTLMSWASLIYFNLRKRREISKELDAMRFICFSMLFFIFFYVLFHSLFYILPRYILPIVPLYTISFAYLLQRALAARPRSGGTAKTMNPR